MVGWLARLVSLVSWLVANCWLDSLVSWLADLASWLTGLTGLVSWLAGLTSWLAGLTSWLAGLVSWLVDWTSSAAWSAGLVAAGQYQILRI